MDVITCDREAVNCVENVFTTPGIEAINAIQATAEENEKDRASSTDPHREPDADQETVGQGFSPADSSERPETETAAEKNPWSAWAWLGLCKTSTRKIPNAIPNIVHVDVDAFFASVEQVLNPKLRGKPVLVGRGCVASASYEAKFRGVKTAMSFREALRICPQAIVVPGQYEHYADFAERVRRILETYTPAVETAALDDFYLHFGGPGLDGREVLLPSTPKSVSRETTIEGGTIDTEFLGGLIEYLSERIGSTLREYGKQARTIGLRIRYVDHFSAHQTVRLTKPTNDERELLAAAKDLFTKLFTRRVPVRLSAGSGTTLHTDKRQHELFDTNTNHRWDLNRGL